jgi:hypothetical protein
MAMTTPKEYRPLDDAARLTGDMQYPSLYLNIFIAQKTEEMNKIIQEQIDQKVPNPLGFGLLRKAAGKIAMKKVTTDLIAAKMAQKIPDVMPAKMAEMGIEADVEEVYRKGSFVVLHITIVNSDIHKLIEAKLDGEKADKVDRVLDCLKYCARCFGKEEFLEDKVQYTMNSKIAEAMAEKLGQTLPEKMAEKGLIVDVVGRTEATEAAFLFEALKHLDDGPPPNTEAGDGSAPEPPRYRKFLAKFRR